MAKTYTNKAEWTKDATRNKAVTLQTAEQSSQAPHGDEKTTTHAMLDAMSYGWWSDRNGQGELCGHLIS